MPIDGADRKEARQNLPTEETLRLCRAYAAEQIESQKRDFQRLGVLATGSGPI